MQSAWPGISVQKVRSLWRPRCLPLQTLPQRLGLVGHLEQRVQQVWELRCGNKWKEVWCRLLRSMLHGVEGAGGRGGAWAQDRRCEYGWYPLVGILGQLARTSSKRMCFGGCPCAQAVLGLVLESLPQLGFSARLPPLM